MQPCCFKDLFREAGLKDMLGNNCCNSVCSVLQSFGVLDLDQVTGFIFVVAQH